MAFDADRFFSHLNPLIGGILRTPVLHRILSPGLLLLTVTGRKTGRRYSIPVGYQSDGDDLCVMVSKAWRKQWWRNFREPGEVELHLRGRSLRGRAEVVPVDTDEFRRLAERTLRRMPWLASQFGIELDRGAGLSDEQLATLRKEIAAVKISPEA